MKNLSNKENSSLQITFASKGDQLNKYHLSSKSIHNSHADPLKQSSTNLTSTIHKINKSQIRNKLSTHTDDLSFGSNIVIDYQNAKFQGRLMNQILNQKGQRFTRAGLGILMDDQLNFLLSNWKNDHLSGKSLLLNRSKNYLFGKWSQQTNNPSGPIVIRVNTFIMITKFKERTGKWCMTETERNVILIYDESTANLLVLTARMQQSFNEYKCSKTTPLTVVEFAHFDSGEKVEKQLYKNKNKNRHKQGQNTKEILSFYCQKYGIQIDESSLSLPQYLQQIANDAQLNCAKSKKFEIIVSKNLVCDLFGKQKEIIKESQTYQTQKHKVFDNNCIVYKQHVNKSQNSKETFTYFGFLGGLGIKFSNMEKQCKSTKEIKYTQTSTMKLKSMGNHNSHYKIQDIGGRFYDNKCIQEGNFKSKSTFTYEDVLFRPSNKLASLYNKYHKQQVHFINEYFDKSKLTIFKLLSNFQAFVDEHVIYVMNECYLESTKFQQKEQKNQLVSSLWTLKSKIDKIDHQEPPKSTKSREPAYQVQIQRKSKSKSKSKNKFQKQKKQGLTALKNKNKELKEKIKKVKYEIQYEPQNSNENIIFVNDDKFISKIKKHLVQSRSISSINQNNKTASNSKSKSQTNYRTRKDKKSYIEKSKEKILSSPKIEFNDDSLEKIGESMIKRVQGTDRKEKQKTKSQKMLQKINGNIGFKQKFNYGIEYHKLHESCRGRNQVFPAKNKYNGRERLFTDDDLDKALDNTNFSASEVPVRSITPGGKSRRKEQYRHYIYSNTQRNIHNEEQNYHNQKQIQDTIRAEMLGMPVCKYREMILTQRKYQQFVAEKLLQIIDLEESILKISRRNDQIGEIDANDTFGFQQEAERLQHEGGRERSLSRTVKQRLALKRAEQKHLINGQRILNPIIYCPKPRQQSLVQRRLRILQEYKQFNSKDQIEGVNDNNESSAIMRRMNESPIYNKDKLFGDKMFGISVGSKSREFLDVNRLPIYYDQMNQKVLSPLSTIKHDLSTIADRSIYVQLNDTKGRLRNQVVDSIKETPLKQKGAPIPNKQNQLEPPKTCITARKYQYYFDK